MRFLFHYTIPFRVNPHLSINFRSKILGDYLLYSDIYKLQKNKKPISFYEFSRCVLPVDSQFNRVFNI